MPRTSDDGKFIHCVFCNQKFRFEYDAVRHEQDKHADKL
jgi:redox-regulated HSP33 family molecular chaperone